MKTKPFLLATAGSTVDGRVIDAKMLQEMASSYDPKTYAARLNIEHIRGISGEGPFRAYGDVLELSTGEVEVNFNGRTEKRLGLYGVFDVTEEAKRLNEAGQKVYPSIEIRENFCNKGFAYLKGCALTDSPAAIATERLQFNRTLPGGLTVSGETASVLEFADETAVTEGGKGLLAAMGQMFDAFAARFAAAPAQNSQQAQKEAGQDDQPGTPAALDFTQLRPLFEDLGKSFAASVEGLRGELRDEVDALAVKLSKLEATAETTPDRSYTARPVSNGNAGNYSGIF